MEAALVWYTLLNLAILGFIVLFVRASRARAVPNERQDLEENALVAADWELVRRERCLPSGCPRVRGQPPRPRKDVTCEICAATFLEIRLQRLLEGPLAPEPSDPGAEGLIMDGGIRSTHPATAPVSRPLTVRGNARELDVRPVDTRLRRATRKHGPARAAGRWVRIRFGVGIGCVAAGAAVAAFGGLLWLIIPGYLMVLLGLGLIASSASSDAI
jgi:hypothetical protein